MDSTMLGTDAFEVSTMNASSKGLLQRFLGGNGKRHVVESLRTQRIIGNSENIAKQLADVAILEAYAPGSVIFNHNDSTNDIFFILGGRVSIEIHGRQVNTRGPGQHIGEMAAIDVHALRSASVIAIQETIAAKVAERDFAEVADANPSIWRQLACELGERLRQRGANVRPKNAVPVVFIGSSSEAVAIARSIQAGIQRDDIAVKVWAEGVFRASRTTIEDLEREAHEVDFAVLVVTPDDTIESRGTQQLGPRDNVIFELGLFMGALGRERTFIVARKGADIKIPTDLLGVTRLAYLPSAESASEVEIAGICDTLVELVQTQGQK